MIFRSLLFLLSLGMAGCVLAESDSASLVLDYADGIQAFALPPLGIAYQSYLRAELSRDDIAEQREFFQRIQHKAKQVRAQDSCLQLDLERLREAVGMHLLRLDAVEAVRSTNAVDAAFEGGLSTFDGGRHWYRYLLRRYLGSGVTPDELWRFGEQRTQQAIADYRAMRAEMGYAGRDEEFERFLDSESFFYPQGETPLQDYQRAQREVWQRLPELFRDYGVKPAGIRQSTRGAAFPADGYYERSDATFYFNLARERFDRRNVAMLFLHEGSPGHHFQVSVAQRANECDSLMPATFAYGYVEGWAAYVEEYGQRLGAYSSPALKLGAIEWDLVRSIRVILDVAINDRGWSHQQALDYWHKTLPMLPELAEREVSRLRNWPAQAITYKYGAAVIRELREQQRQALGTAFNLPEFHHQILRYGDLPLDVLRAVVKGP